MALKMYYKLITPLHIVIRNNIAKPPPGPHLEEMK